MSKKLKNKPTGVSQPLALQYVEEAFAVVVEIMRDAGAAQATRLRAAAVVIERAWGRVGAAVKAAAAVATAPPGLAMSAADTRKEDRFTPQGPPRFARAG